MNTSELGNPGRIWVTLPLAWFMQWQMANPPKDYRRRYGHPPAAARSDASDKAESTIASKNARFNP